MEHYQPIHYAKEQKGADNDDDYFVIDTWI